MLHQLFIRVWRFVHSINEGYIKIEQNIDWKLETNNFDDSTVHFILYELKDDTTAAHAAAHIKESYKLWHTDLEIAAFNERLRYHLASRHFMDEVDDDIDTWPVGAPSIPHEQPAPPPATQPAPTRRQGAPKKQLFPSEETLDAKRAEFLREYDHRFPGRQKTITTTVKEDTFNKFVINMALRWGDEFPALQKGMGSAWEHFLASMKFTWVGIEKKTWRDQIRTHIERAWDKKKKKQNKPKQT